MLVHFEHSYFFQILQGNLQTSKLNSWLNHELPIHQQVSDNFTDERESWVQEDKKIPASDHT